jgi:Ca2+-binding EF-hand superfamily protein
MPRVPPDLMFIYEAFWHLIADRDFNGIIPTSEIVSYMTELGLTATSERLMFIRLIRAMDLAHLEATRELTENANG